MSLGPSGEDGDATKMIQKERYRRDSLVENLPQSLKSSKSRQASYESQKEGGFPALFDFQSMLGQFSVFNKPTNDNHQEMLLNEVAYDHIHEDTYDIWLEDGPRPCWVCKIRWKPWVMLQQLLGK